MLENNFDEKNNVITKCFVSKFFVFHWIWESNFVLDYYRSHNYT
jgi:hypothetical protein